MAADLRASIWKQMVDAGIRYIAGSDTFIAIPSTMIKCWDTTAEIQFDTYFSMAGGNACVPAMEMTECLDTN